MVRRPFSPKANRSEGPLVRMPASPKVRQSEGSLVRRPASPKNYLFLFHLYHHCRYKIGFGLPIVVAGFIKNSASDADIIYTYEHLLKKKKKTTKKKNLHAFYVKIVRTSRLFYYASQTVLFRPCKIVTVPCKIDHLNSSGRFTGGRSKYVKPSTKFNNKFL